MERYWDIIVNSYSGYANWIWGQITFMGSEHWWHNYFWYLVLISAVFFGLEWNKPWRKDQPRFRKGFWLDFFYMFFNFFLFSLIVFNAASDVLVNLWNDFLVFFGFENTVALKVAAWPVWSQLLLLFVLKDFIEWWIHRLLHVVPALWEFHKVHHSVEQMGFAAHLRYHWMESLIYKSIVYIPISMIGFGIDDFFIVHIFAIAVGHWNHANFRVRIGALGYILNNPNMHMWHHAYEMPPDKPLGINFGLTLSVWDYVFRTAHIPYNGRDIKLGFPGMKNFPKTFWGQITYGFRKGNSEL